MCVSSATSLLCRPTRRKLHKELTQSTVSLLLHPRHCSKTWLKGPSNDPNGRWTRHGKKNWKMKLTRDRQFWKDIKGDKINLTRDYMYSMKAKNHIQVLHSMFSLARRVLVSSRLSMTSIKLVDSTWGRLIL